MDVENSMVIGATDEYERLNQEMTDEDIAVANAARECFIRLILSGKPAMTKSGELYELQMVWDGMPARFLANHENFSDEQLCQFYQLGHLVHWEKDIKHAVEQLADTAGWEYH